MGLIKAAKDAISTMLADQWREYFYCDSLSNDVLMVKGQKRITEGRNSNTKGVDNIITNGSVIAVNEGQCMIIVDQGGIVDVCAEAGEFVYDHSSEPTIFYGGLGEGVKQSFSNIGRRFTFGGNTAKDQRVYFFNTKEIMNNLFGTPSPIPFRVLDRNTGYDFDTAVKVNGQYSFKIADPILFYTNVCANVTDSYKKTDLLTTLKSELLTALQPALAKVSAQGVRPYEIPGFSADICKYLAEELSQQWTELRGLVMVKMTINSADMPAEDRQRFQKWQDTAMLRSADMQAARQSEAMATMIENTNLSGGNGSGGGSPMEGAMNMMAMGMMGNMMGGGNAFGNMMGGNRQQAPMQQSAQQGMPQMQAPGAGAGAAVLGWTCQCGRADNRGKFCMECGKPKPSDAGWTCGCGTVNQGKFCTECGNKKPEGAPLYKCDKCGWEPEDPAHPPKFCPECGDVFDESDRI
ncbi:MAG: SPFH domain-containing protein [Lachnospiraceae bacterium]|nr:SPFH domain-containing protein [Lachnospiraceae bacterium]MCM1240900.1 SPFH domain-containing protein [Lachnospiraceae bacterium]